jgi:hypothetical protein
VAVAHSATGCLKGLAGLLLVFLVHIPRLIYSLLQVSYAYVFNNYANLTADPKEHLKRARNFLKKDNSQLLYAALEIRFALERMVQTELVFAEKATARSIQETDPIKKLKALHRLNMDAADAHKIILVNRETGERFDWAEYKPLDLDRVRTIQGRLGDLLHPKLGLRLGLRNDPWYQDTRAFLIDAEQYLSGVLKDSTPFFAYEGLQHIEMERQGRASTDNSGLVSPNPSGF